MRRRQLTGRPRADRALRHRALIAPVVLAAALAVGACATSGSASSGPSQQPIAVSGAWARPAPAGGQTAAYFTITNGGSADRLVKVQCPIAGSAMLHRTATDSSGMTGMSMVDAMAIPADSEVTLEPGGFHVMLTGLDRALAAGETIELSLVFERAGTIVVPATIRAG